MIMKRIIFILLAAVSILVFIIGIGLHIFINTQGKTILQHQIQKSLGRKATIQSLSVHFPVNLNIKKLDINGLSRVENIYIKPSLVGFMLGKIILNELIITRPVVYLERIADGKLSTPFLPPKISAFGAKQWMRSRTKIFSAVRNLKLVDGEIKYVDKKITQEGLAITLKDLNIDIQNIFVLPYSIITRFQLKGILYWSGDSQQQGSISFSGWTDLHKKAGQAELRIADIDAIYLYPYYDKFVSLEQTNIEKARLHFSSNMTADNNNLTAECHLELGQLVFKEKQPAEQQPRFDESKVSQILDIFKTSNDKILLDFVIKTRLDKPVFGLDNIRMAVDDRISRNHKNGVRPQDILKVPGKFVTSAVEGTTEISKAFVSGITALGLEIKKAFEAAFRREDKEAK